MRYSIMRVYLLCLCLFGALTAQAQHRRGRDTLFYRETPIPAHLRPIERAIGNVYFYGGKRLSSPYSLEVPFYELDDPMVNRHFRNFRTWTTLSRLTGLATLAYVLFDKNGRNGTYWTVYGGSIVAAVTFTIIGNGQVSKAVTRYNEMLRQVPAPRVGLSVVPLPTGGPVVGIGLAQSF